MNSGSRGLWVALICWVLSALLAGCAEMPPPPDDRKDRITASDETEPVRRARVRMELATAYYSRGQMTTALDEVKQALVISPNLGEAFNLRGLIYAALGDDVLAQESFRRALQINSADSDTMHNYGRFLCQRARYDEAEPLFARALAQPRYMNTVRTLLVSGACQAKAGKWVEAEATLARAYELDPSNAATSYNLSEVLLHRGELERARFYMRRVNAVPDQSNAQTLWLAARIEAKMGNRDAANEYGKQLRSRFPQSPESTYFDQKKFNE